MGRGHEGWCSICLVSLLGLVARAAEAASDVLVAGRAAQRRKLFGARVEYALLLAHQVLPGRACLR